MKEPAPFMTADWRYVLGVTYAADAARLERHVPRGAELDSLDGAPRVSVVAFHFRRTRVRGIAIPGHVNFPEINLRFYVRSGGRRAVVFIREFVPRPAIAIVARLLYNEPYRTIRMRDEVILPADGPDGVLGVRHRFGPGLRNRLQAWADPAAADPAPDSPEHWLTHHDLGVGSARDGRARSYGVEHDVWGLHRVRDLTVDIDFAALYGAEWGWLKGAEPSHVTLAAGSSIRVLAPQDA